jgi:uncharacterized membrane protein
MSATISHPSIAIAATARPLCFGVEAGPGEYAVQWLLKRSDSTNSRRTTRSWVSMGLLATGIALVLWAKGVTLALPVTTFEAAAFAAALLFYARHAGDRESIRLQAGRLTVEHVSGRRVERAEFAPAWVRVEPAHGERSLVELSGQGKRISVGRFVRPELRGQLADELRWALRRWQRFPAPAPVASATREESQDKSEN